MLHFEDDIGKRIGVCPQQEARSAAGGTIAAGGMSAAGSMSRRHARKKPRHKCEDPLERPKGFRLLTVEWNLN